MIGLVSLLCYHVIHMANKALIIKLTLTLITLYCISSACQIKSSNDINKYMQSR